MKINERNKMTFPQLWKKLTIEEAAMVRKNVTIGMKITPSTFWRWWNGYAVPRSLSDKKDFVNIINETLGLNTDADTLFPESK
jgi:hypothetical protein